MDGMERRPGMLHPIFDSEQFYAFPPSGMAKKGGQVLPARIVQGMRLISGHRFSDADWAALVRLQARPSRDVSLNGLGG